MSHLITGGNAFQWDNNSKVGFAEFTFYTVGYLLREEMVVAAWIVLVRQTDLDMTHDMH